MMDISFLLDDPAFNISFTVVRRTETVNDRGRAEFIEEHAAMIGVVQPATARELERLPEGERDKETLTIYTRQPLRVGSVADGTATDRVLYGGTTYFVAAVETWPGYTRALVQREADRA